MKLKTFIIIGAIIALYFGFSFMRSANKESHKNIPMNNQICPVTGNPVNDEDTYIHKGKEYKLCSDKCKEALSENPEKYISD